MPTAFQMVLSHHESTNYHSLARPSTPDLQADTEGSHDGFHCPEEETEVPNVPQVAQGHQAKGW